MTKKISFIVTILFLAFQTIYAQNKDQTNDTLSKFDKFNIKAEALFKIIPVPIISYSQEAGNIIGLAKFNAFALSKKDTISQPSKISESVSFSTKGRVNVNVANDLIFNENNYFVLSKFRYAKQPEFLFGIGNDVSIDDSEEVTNEHIGFEINALKRIYKKLYVGIAIELDDYLNIKTEPDSFLIEDMISGLNGGTNFGLGVSVIWDSRDNRYNAHNGSFLKTSFMTYEKSLGSAYQFNRFELDARKYFNPWLKHVVAMQATTTSLGGDIPYYDLALLGGQNKMRGYYQGALRDKVLFDTQVEYRMPVWKIIGLVGWVGTGRVAESYKAIDLNGFWMSYGGGLRIKVDSENDINIRIDAGFGNNGIKGVYFNFSEAF